MARIKLLPAQYELISDRTTRVLGEVAGLGSGKTYGAVLKAFYLAAEMPDLPGMMVEPTYPMVKDILLPTLKEVADTHNIAWRYNKQDHDFFVYLKNRWVEIRLRNASDPNKLAGPTLPWSIMDEVGQMSRDAFNIVNSRVRHPNSSICQLICVGTPEGLNHFYENFEEDPLPNSRLIRAKTDDNPYLPENYIESGLAGYSEHELLAYRFGKFVPPSGRVYPLFDRMRHNCHPGKLKWAGQPVMFCDFNVNKMCWCLGTLLPDHESIYIWDEIIGTDTTTHIQAEEACNRWAHHFEEKFGYLMNPSEAAKLVHVITDNSGNSRISSASKSDRAHLADAGFVVRRPSKKRNPLVSDRVFSVNTMFKEDRLFIDKEGARFTFQCFATQEKSDDGSPDKKKGFDHAPDAIGYGVWYYYPTHKPRGNNANAFKANIYGATI